jgi:pimeloyl-ACP methyl ester carboxylesterase
VRSYRGAPEIAGPELAGAWAAVLGPDISVDIAYYAHRLHLGTAQGDDSPEHLPLDAQELIAVWAGLLGAPTATAQGYPTIPVRDLVSWVARKFGLDHDLALWFITTFFREVHTYFTEPERHAGAIEDVAAAIRRVEPSVLIAHSLGSVVAYETLWTAPNLPPIDRFLTIGSPLAMPDIVYDRLHTRDGPHARPPGIQEWINLADRGDFIAIPPGGISEKFDGVSADLTDMIGCFAFHRVTRYLASPPVTQIIKSLLTTDGQT